MQLIRAEPLETTTVSVGGHDITIPTEAEILRIKGFLLLRRNEDYVDFAAHPTGSVMHPPPRPSSASTNPQDSGESAFQQMLAQLASPMPYDLEGTVLSEYNRLESPGTKAVRAACARAATAIFDHGCDREERSDDSAPEDGRGG